MDKAEASQAYGANAVYNYKMFVRDGHRHRWQEGDWTDDSGKIRICE